MKEVDIIDDFLQNSANTIHVKQGSVLSLTDSHFSF
jgi:hypothetical protein